MRRVSYLLLRLDRVRAGQQHLLSEEDFMQEIRFKACPEDLPLHTYPLARIKHPKLTYGYFPQYRWVFR